MTLLKVLYPTINLGDVSLNDNTCTGFIFGDLLLFEHLYQDCSSTKTVCWKLNIKKSLKYQRGNQSPYIEEGQTTQWPKEKVQKDKQRSTKHTYKPIDRVTRTPPKTGGELRCSGRVSSSCSTINFGIVPTVWESLFFIVLFAYINRVFFFEHTRQN
jgi:hypothetical protein